MSTVSSNPVPMAQQKSFPYTIEKILKILVESTEDEQYLTSKELEEDFNLEVPSILFEYLQLKVVAIDGVSTLK